MKNKNIVESWHGHHFNVLGTEYTLFAETSENEKQLKESLAFADYYGDNRRIVCDKEQEYKSEVSFKAVIRHELIHCFLYESGLDVCSNSTTDWARNEEMVDWFALQSPKIFRLFEEHDLF